MKRLIIEGSDYTPTIDLDPDKKILKFSGISRPENVGLFFQGVIEWISELGNIQNSKQTSETYKIIFQLDYCNSPSQKYFILILEEIQKIGARCIEVDWYYDTGDDKMLEDGEDIADALGMQFNFKEFSSTPVSVIEQFCAHPNMFNTILISIRFNKSNCYEWLVLLLLPLRRLKISYAL